MYKQDPKNYRKHGTKNQAIIKKSLVECGAGRSVQVDADDTLIAGNGVMEQAKKLGIATRVIETDGSEQVVVKRTDLHSDDNKRKKLALADNAASDSSEWDTERLQADWSPAEQADWGIGKKPAKTMQEAEKSVQVDKVILNERMDKAKYVFGSFSGGRDSTRAQLATYRKFSDTGKHCEVLYVDNRMEFPDQIQHIRRVCATIGAKLTAIPTNKDLWTEYYSKGEAPSHIYMPCVSDLINSNLDEYCKSITRGEDYILVRGGQKKQKTRQSKTDSLQTVKTNANMIIYNPLFDMTDDQQSAPIPEWIGYSKGFQRTACWACPFQKKEQWEALKVNYPLLFEELKSIFTSITFKIAKGDGLKNYLVSYWEQQEGVNLKIEDY